MELRRIDETGLKLIKAGAEGCPLCAGTGWKTLPAHAPTDKDKDKSSKDRRVTRCDCQLRARSETLLASARIPKRYEHCELASYTTDFPGANSSLALAHVKASRFAQEYDPSDSSGLLMVGDIGTGKTHLAVAIIKELIRSKGIGCLFYDYRELLKEIQNSYSPSVQATEFNILRPVFETEVLVIDELGGQIPSGWVFDTVSLIINTRYNEQKTTIVTTNFEDLPAAPERDRDELIDQFQAKQAGRKYTLGDRIGERMRSRLHEMCIVVKMKGADFRQTFRSASHR
jgi:DNA replication protein DnaC